jgi:hypothetical protein
VGPFWTASGTRWDQDPVQDHAVFESWNTLSNRPAEEVQPAAAPQGMSLWTIGCAAQIG